MGAIKGRAKGAKAANDSRTPEERKDLSRKMVEAKKELAKLESVVL